VTLLLSQRVRQLSKINLITYFVEEIHTEILNQLTSDYQELLGENYKQITLDSIETFCREETSRLLDTWERAEQNTLFPYSIAHFLTRKYNI
jgi:hypothetical protein